MFLDIYEWFSIHQKQVIGKLDKQRIIAAYYDVFIN